MNTQDKGNGKDQRNASRTLLDKLNHDKVDADETPVNKESGRGSQHLASQPMGGLGGSVDSKAGTNESDQQQIGGTTADNQGENPALR